MVNALMRFHHGMMRQVEALKPAMPLVLALLAALILVLIFVGSGK